MSFLITLVWILIFLIIILGSITIHEFGHFLALKKMKVFVHEFAIGFGPAILKWGKGETQYTLRSLPLGGYVLPASRYSSEAFPNIVVSPGRSVEDLPLIKKFLFVLAGIMMNVIAAFLFSLTYFLIKDHLHTVSSYGDFIKQSVVGFFVAFGNIFTGNNTDSIVTQISWTSKQDASHWLAIICLLIISINFNLAFFNVIPFPPLDGWRIVEFTYESASKKQIRENTRVIVTIMGIAILVLFTIFVFVSPYIHH